MEGKWEQESFNETVNKFKISGKLTKLKGNGRPRKTSSRDDHVLRRMAALSPKTSCNKNRLIPSAENTSVSLRTISRRLTPILVCYPKILQGIQVWKRNDSFLPDSIRIRQCNNVLLCHFSMRQVWSNFLHMLQVFAAQVEKYMMTYLRFQPWSILDAR